MNKAIPEKRGRAVFVGMGILAFVLAFLGGIKVRHQAIMEQRIHGGLE